MRHKLNLSLFIGVFLLSDVNSLRFLLTPNVKKCLKDEIHKNVVVKGEYEFGEGAGQKASVIVTDPKGQALYKREDFSETKGKFAFTAEENYIYDMCFLTKLPPGTRSGPPREVYVTMKEGIEAKDYGEIAKAEKLKPLEVELRRLEDLVDAAAKDFEYMRTREEEMRNTNESTNSRVLYLSMFSMCCLLGLAMWQVLYLRHYFKAKKLID